ncbi:hypothetical protein [Pseudoalteromonas phenolica]|uniref:Uncharacterized protein n=1 Tax=Pseudoalteromonas phenolica TaxID=161398 RepID=A0A0S2K1R8_9GAMM|nr:hypothetical protein [Pseudoalteromonas phenolica]ALO42021.1 hypothetical protein PP2015_1517 [Pseudoalteromonas phenolica]MBE0353416.1 hypothetical protein [Pseudoalteromonas phenolica O-BC30]RXF01843.1 hypothetical protein D9981_08230 [Pseudoalteromonas phenolica O-BC30]TMO55245.1 hypothetical protein CWC21_11180 [Pseudoalteromonas phenolica]
MTDKNNEPGFIADYPQSLMHDQELLMSARASALKDYFASRTAFNLKVESNNENGSDESEQEV